MRRRHSVNAGEIPRLGPSAPLPLFGREREIQTILEALQHGPVCVVGPVGVGKTELLREIARRAVAKGRVAEVTCRPGEPLDAVVARGERLLDVIPGTLAEALASRQALLVVDDVHHLGSDAAQLLQRAGRGALLCASEDHIPLRREASELRLLGVSVEEARLMWQRLEELFGPTAHDSADAAIARTRGLPLALRREYALAAHHATKSWDVSSLPREEAKLLAAAAVAGTASPALLAHLCGGNVDVSLDALVRRQLLCATREGTFIIHDVTRAAVLAALAAEQRRALESALAAALLEHAVAVDAQLPDEVDRVLGAASHLVAAERHADAVALLERHESILLARGGAAETLAIVEQVARRWSAFSLTSLHVRVLLRCGRVAAAREVFSAAGPAADARARLAGAEAALAAGEPSAAAALIEPLTSHAELRGRAVALSTLIDRERGLLPAVDETGPATRLLAQGRVAEAEAELVQAERAARAEDAVLAADELRRQRAMVAFAAGRLVEAQGTLTTLAADARARGAELMALRVEADLAQVLVRRGRAQAGMVLASATLEEAELRGLATLAAHAELARAAAALESLQPALAVSGATALLTAPQAPPRVRAEAGRIAARASSWLGGARAPVDGKTLDDVLAAADIAMACGASDAALELFTAAAERADRTGRRADLATALAAAARLHHARGDHPAAAAAAARALTEGSAGGADRTVAIALLVTAALSRDEGNVVAARTAATDALTVARAAGLGVERYASAIAAEVLARLAGDAVSVETLANVARATSATLGDVAVGAADRLLADLGLTASCAYRLIAADGGVSYAATADAARLGLDRRELVIDGAAEAVLRHGKPFADLRRRTLLKRLLFLFAAAPGRVFLKEEIVERIWGVEYHPLHHDAALFTNVMRLRRLLGPNGPDVLRVADGGYLLAPPRDFLFLEKLPG